MAEKMVVGACAVACAAGCVDERARQLGVSLAVAESCTGGRVSAAMTAIPGSSGYFVGGVVSYANRAKSGLLGVPEAMLKAHGAVSEPVARAMAEGVRTALGADFSVATTGIAGPGGGSAAKPVGTVWFAWASATVTQAVCRHFDGNRDEVQTQATAAALELLAGGMGAE
jgi:nicotinamide-nucleotide amidase